MDEPRYRHRTGDRYNSHGNYARSRASSPPLGSQRPSRGSYHDPAAAVPPAAASGTAAVGGAAGMAPDTAVPTMPPHPTETPPRDRPGGYYGASASASSNHHFSSHGGHGYAHGAYGHHGGGGGGSHGRPVANHYGNGGMNGAHAHAHPHGAYGDRPDRDRTDRDRDRDRPDRPDRLAYDRAHGHPRDHDRHGPDRGHGAPVAPSALGSRYRSIPSRYYPGGPAGGGGGGGSSGSGPSNSYARAAPPAAGSVAHHHDAAPRGYPPRDALDGAAGSRGSVYGAVAPGPEAPGADPTRRAAKPNEPDAASETTTIASELFASHAAPPPPHPHPHPPRGPASSAAGGGLGWARDGPGDEETKANDRHHEPASRTGAPLRATPPVPPDQWRFTERELAQTPSIVQGMPMEQERTYRSKACSFIFQIGTLLRVTQNVMTSATIYLHRFYMRQSFQQHQFQEVAAAAIFVASKVEEHHRRIDAVILAVARTMSKSDVLQIPEHHRETRRWNDRILFYEQHLLAMICYDLGVMLPYTPLMELCHLFNVDRDLLRSAWGLVNDSTHTVIWLIYSVNEIAAACLYLAYRGHKRPLPDAFAFLDTADGPAAAAGGDPLASPGPRLTPRRWRPPRLLLGSVAVAPDALEKIIGHIVDFYDKHVLRHAHAPPASNGASAAAHRAVHPHLHPHVHPHAHPPEASAGANDAPVSRPLPLGSSAAAALPLARPSPPHPTPSNDSGGAPPPSLSDRDDRALGIKTTASPAGSSDAPRVDRGCKEPPAASPAAVVKKDCLASSTSPSQGVGPMQVDPVP